jgi:hypothetical protein
MADYINNLKKTKERLIIQLRDYEWRLEQESKAFHKANDSRKELNQSIMDARNILSILKDETTKPLL